MTPAARAKIRQTFLGFAAAERRLELDYRMRAELADVERVTPSGWISHPRANLLVGAEHAAARARQWDEIADRHAGPSTTA